MRTISKEEAIENLIIEARFLIDKMKEIEADKSFKNVFDLSSIKGQPYEGPTWSVELFNAEKALKQVVAFYPTV